MPSPKVIHDLVVLLPGIMGSTLAQQGTPVWSPSAGAVLNAIATFGKSIRKLTLPADIGDGHPNDGVEPMELMPDLHLLPGIWSANIGYEKLFDWLRTKFHLIPPSPTDPSRIPNLLPVPYDWRLSNRFNARRLKTIVEPALERWRSQGEPFSDAKIIFICHSMGGLVARWYIEKEGGAAITNKLITMGTPYRGALNALDHLVNGVRKGIGPLTFDLTTFARSLPSLHQLLPEYACIESPGGLRKTTEISVPQLNASMAADAMQFHDELDEAAVTNTAYRYDVHPIVGTQQATFTTARIVNDSVQAFETINDKDEGGDATVPLLSAFPKGVFPNSPIIRRIADKHGSLQSNQAVFDELEGVLTGNPVIHRASSDIKLSVRVEPIVLAGEDVIVEARVAEGDAAPLQVRVFDEAGRELSQVSPASVPPSGRLSLKPFSPGAYNIVAGGEGPLMESLVAPVTSTVLVWR